MVYIFTCQSYNNWQGLTTKKALQINEGLCGSLMYYVKLKYKLLIFLMQGLLFCGINQISSNKYSGYK